MDKKMFTFLNCLCLCSYALGHTMVARAVSDTPQTTTDSPEVTTVEYCGRSILPPSFPLFIIGGRDARHGQYPWMISFQISAGRGFRHACGATLINENWIVTAAHCIQYIDQPKKYQALAGLHKLSEENESTVQRITFSKIVVHEEYDKKAIINDIALLKTAKPVDISGSKGYVNVICLPKPDEDPKVYATVIGWGHTSQGGNKSDTLREVFVPIISKDLCNLSYGGKILDTMICAGSENKDSCQADSGGPLFQTNSDGVSTFIGVVSFGRGCGKKNYPGVYTKVSAYLDWIEKVTAMY